MIEITCYGKKYKFKTEQEAFDYFKECISCCDILSSEAARYMAIIQQILEHQQTIIDEELV